MSGWYLAGKEGLLARTIPQAASIYTVGINEDYVYDESHTDLSIFTPHILLPELLLTGVDFTGGILRGTNPSWAAAGAGISDRSLILQGVAIYFGLDAERTLLAFIDSGAAGLPQTLTGVDISGRWGSNGILKL